MRDFFYVIGFSMILSAFAFAQTSNPSPESEPSPPANEDIDPTPDRREEPAERDLDEFFKEGEKQLEEDGQSCQPEPEPMS